MTVKLVGADPGVTAAVNGGTHMALEDAGILRAIPGVRIVEPSDSVMMRALVKQVAGSEGVDYLRIARKQGVRLYRDGSRFEIGRAALLREGGDVTLIASGIMVHQALEAARQLHDEGIEARVLDMFTLKPIDREHVTESARKTGAVVTCENHNIIGALGSAVAEVLSEHCPVPLERVGVPDVFGEVGSQQYLMERFHLTCADICAKARRAVARKEGRS